MKNLISVLLRWWRQHSSPWLEPEEDVSGGDCPSLNDGHSALHPLFTPAPLHPIFCKKCAPCRHLTTPFLTTSIRFRMWGKHTSQDVIWWKKNEFSQSRVQKFSRTFGALTFYHALGALSAGCPQLPLLQFCAGSAPDSSAHFFNFQLFRCWCWGNINIKVLFGIKTKQFSWIR